VQGELCVRPYKIRRRGAACDHARQVRVYGQEAAPCERQLFVLCPKKSSHFLGMHPTGTSPLTVQGFVRNIFVAADVAQW
jgi:hypothetical protein